MNFSKFSAIYRIGKIVQRELSSPSTPLVSLKKQVATFEIPKIEVSPIPRDTIRRDLLMSSPECDIYLIQWGEEYSSPIHNHASDGCILRVLQGSLIERRYSDLQSKEFTLSALQTGHTSFLRDDIGVHSVKNIGKGDAVSLHIYAPGSRF